MTKTNVLVAVGPLGSKEFYLNVTVEEAKRRYIEDELLACDKVGSVDEGLEWLRQQQYDDASFITIMEFEDHFSGYEVYSMNAVEPAA